MRQEFFDIIDFPLIDHDANKMSVYEMAICQNCGVEQHDQIDRICMTCLRAELVNMGYILKL